MFKLNKIILALLIVSVVSITGMLFVSYAQAAGGHEGHDGERTSQVTVRSDRLEIFMEHSPIVANAPTKFITHVTDLVTLEPRREGPVTFELNYNAYISFKHTDISPAREGIYIPELSFSRPGEWKMALIIPIAGKKHRIELPPFTVYATIDEADHAAMPEEIAGISFLKEQQWKVPTKIEPVQKQKVADREVLSVPESAIIEQSGQSVVFVQVAGETFTKRHVKLGARKNDFVEVQSGLSPNEYIVCQGAEVIAAAEFTEHDELEGHDHAKPAQAEDGHKEHDQSQRVSVTQEQVTRLGIKITRATRGIVRREIRAPGEIKVNSDRIAHVVPQISGVVLQVSAVLGQQVKKGQVLAFISSRDLAEAKADYLASVERFKLAQELYDREKRLHETKVSSEQDFLAARQVLAETKILERSARLKLLTFGISPSRLLELGTEPENEFTLYRLLSPFDGTVISKHIALGEIVDEQEEVFVIADLSSVWVDLAISQDTIHSVQKGYTVIIHLPDGSKSETEICYVPPIVAPDTRMAVAHATLDNSNGLSRPGTFVDAFIRIPSKEETTVIPKASVQLVNDRTCVFVWGNADFELREVKTGITDGLQIEILQGLRPGEAVASENAFHLKAEFAKSVGSGISGHGHAH